MARQIGVLVGYKGDITEDRKMSGHNIEENLKQAVFLKEEKKQTVSYDPPGKRSS